MFRDMGIPAEFEDMAAATEPWLARHPVAHLSRLDGDGRDGEIAAGGGLIVIPWPPGADDDGSALRVRVQRLYAARAPQAGTRPPPDGCHARVVSQEGIERVVLNASTFGHPLYESMGYVVADEPMMRLRL